MAADHTLIAALAALAVTGLCALSAVAGWAVAWLGYRRMRGADALAAADRLDAIAAEYRAQVSAMIAEVAPLVQPDLQFNRHGGKAVAAARALYQAQEA